MEDVTLETLRDIHDILQGLVKAQYRCRSWDCQLNAKEDSILLRIILLTTSLEWTSIVQIVITFQVSLWSDVNTEIPYFLPLSFWKRAKKEGDEVVEHPNLLLVVVLERALVTLLKTTKRLRHLVRPRNLRSSQGHLSRCVVAVAFDIYKTCAG